VKSNSLRELYLDQLRDLHDTEKQLVKALPKLANAASSSKLRNALQEHLKITKHQVERLEQIFEGLGEKTKSQKCNGMEGLIEEGSKEMKQYSSSGVRDAAIIASAQRVGHYEIAGYGCVRTFATLLGESQAANLLEETLNEEKKADEKLTQLAEEINAEAVEERATVPRGARKTNSRSRRAEPAA